MMKGLYKWGSETCIVNFCFDYFLSGIYIMTVMTMTSVSVIMAVMVINCYHRGQKFFRPPLWANRFILSWLAGILQMQQDVSAAANAIQLVSIR